MERELLQLRPLQNQLSQFTDKNKEQISTNIKIEYEKNKLEKEIVNLQNEVERLRSEKDDSIKGQDML